MKERHPMVAFFHWYCCIGVERECRWHSPNLARDMPAACLRVALVKLCFVFRPVDSPRDHQEKRPSKYGALFLDGCQEKRTCTASLRTASQSPSEAKRKRLARFVAQAFSFDRLEAQQLAVIIVGITSARASHLCGAFTLAVSLLKPNSQVFVIYPSLLAPNGIILCLRSWLCWWVDKNRTGIVSGSRERLSITQVTPRTAKQSSYAICCPSVHNSVIPCSIPVCMPA